jgi:hypothetical protein
MTTLAEDLRAAIEAVKDNLGSIRPYNLIRDHGPTLLAAVEAAGWRPIEAAPRDGTHIILAFGQDHSSEGWWVDDDSEPRPWAFIDIGDYNKVIINRSRDGEYRPSHWRPMPYREPRNRAAPPPAQTKGE